MNKIITATRWLYALFYIMIGIQALAVLAGVTAMPDYGLSPENAAFQNALNQTGFITPIMGLSYVISGSLMLFSRTAPLGIVLLAPFVVVILFTHLMLNGSPAWGMMHAVLLALFAWQHRTAYLPLWNYEIEKV